MELEGYNLKLLKAKLEYGDMERIAKKAGRHRATVYRFFAWNTPNYEVLKAALELIDEKEDLTYKALQVIWPK